MPADIDPLGWNSDEEDERFPSWSGWTGSVLLNDEIEYYCRPDAKHRLIDPFDTDLLKPARYQLRMGDEARVGNRVIKVAPGQPLKLEPHQVAIVKTYEKLNIPRFLIARWNLTVDMVYQGLLWVGALQVPRWTPKTGH